MCIIYIKDLGEGAIIFLPFGSALCQPLYGKSKGSVLSEGDIGAFVYMSCFDGQRRYQFSMNALQGVKGLKYHPHCSRSFTILPFGHPHLCWLTPPWKVNYLWNCRKSGLGCGPVEHYAWPSVGPCLQEYRPRHSCHTESPIFLGADPPP